jgi:hypothetical protein
MKDMPNTTDWKNRFNVKYEVKNNYSLKDYLRKLSFFIKTKNFITR